MSKRILVVDDDPDIREMLQDRLHAYGYGVETAVDGREALEALCRRSFDGMLLDIGMPEIDGLEVLRRTRERDPVLPVVMITAATLQEPAAQAVAEGAQAYLIKPLDMVGLKQVLARWVGPAT